VCENIYPTWRDMQVIGFYDLVGCYGKGRGNLVDSAVVDQEVHPLTIQGISRFNDPGIFNEEFH
jgi:hypothetical protein